MEEKYGISEEELKDLDVDRFVEDYRLRELYVNDTTSHNFTDAQQEKIKSAYADAGVISWEKDYQGKEIPNTGSFGWKMVFEYKDGTFFACEGFTGDGSHLPDKFDSVDKVLLEIANCD